MLVESLNVITPECIDLLKQNNLLLQLIKLEIIKKVLNDVEIDQEKFNLIKEQVLASQQISNDDQFKQWLIKSNYTEETFNLNLLNTLKVEKYSLKNFSHLTESKFLSIKEDLDQVTYSLLRVKDPYLAKELFQKIIEKEASFEEIANIYSTGPEKNSFGRIGPLPLSQGHPLIKDFLNTNKVGKLSSPINIGNDWVVVRLESIERAVLNKQMEMNLAKRLFNEWIEENALETQKTLLTSNNNSSAI